MKFCSVVRGRTSASRRTPRVGRRMAALSGAMFILTSSLVLVDSLVGSTSASADPAVGPSAVSSTGTGALPGGTVPDGTCRATVVGLGAGGASSSTLGGTGGIGAAGASIAATFAVLPGQAYSGSVGGGGSVPTGGIGGGGTSGTVVNSHRGGGGGGRTVVAIAGATLMIAGGGGGGGAAHQNTPNGNGGAGGIAVGAGVAGPGVSGTLGVDNPATIVVNGGQGGQVAGGGVGGVNTNSAGLNGSAGGAVGTGTGGNGGPDSNSDSGGGGGAGYTGGGGGASTVNSVVTGGGGGGGSSWVAAASPTVTAGAPSSITGAAGITTAAGALPGKDGSLSIDWLPCQYDLALAKTVGAPSVLIGGTVTWTVTVKNNGPDPMTKGDTIDLTDTLPVGPNGPATPAFKVLSISTAGGSNTDMASAALTCTGVAVGSAMPSATNCSRPYSAPLAPGAPSGGTRGLNVGETLTITYEQNISATAPCPATITNTATVKDRPSVTGTTDIVGVTATDTVSTPLSIKCLFTLQLAKALSGNRLVAADQFLMSITPGGTAPTGSSATTTGTNSTVSPGSGVVAVNATSVGSTYSFSEAMASGSASALSQYKPSVNCVNATALSSTVLPASGSATVPFNITPIVGDDISCTISNTPLASSLTIAKSTTSTSYTTVGATVPYSFTVTNTGATTLTAITITDAKVTGLSCAAATLAPGTNTICTGTHTITQADLDGGSIINTASVTGTPSGGSPIPSTSSNTVTVPATQTPQITITKATTKTSFATVGESIPYTFTVTNTGNVTLTAVAVTDPKTSGVSCAASTLASGVATSCTATHTVTQADLDAGSVVNVASVVATPPSGTPLSARTSNTVTVPAVQTATLTIVKATSSSSYSSIGQTLSYTFKVTNTGNVTISNIVVTDAIVTGISCPITTLAPGVFTTCTGTHVVTQTDLNAGSVVNSASVAATKPGGAAITPASSNVVTVPAVQSPQMTVVKSTTRVNYTAVGQTIPYSFVVTNTGNVTLTSVGVADAKTAGVTCPVATLAPGVSTTCTGTHTVTQADLNSGSVVNVANAVGTPPSGTPIIPVPSNTVTVPAVQSPSLSIVKSTSTSSYNAVGNTIAYSFVVTNTGNVTLTSVAVSDPKTAGVTCPVTTLAPGVSTTCSGTHTVTQADLDAGSVVNVASVVGTPPSGTPTSPMNSNQVTVPAVQPPALSISKSTTRVNFNAVGQTIPYSFVVTNTSNVTVTAVSVSDAQTAGTTCPVTTLAPGVSTTCTGTHTVTQGDLDAGSVINTASVVGTPPSGTPTNPVNSNPVTVPAVQSPTLTIVKSTTRVNYNAVGQTIPYSFVVTNTGNVTVTAVSVSDPETAGTTCPVTTLAPGVSTTCTGTHTVTQADLDSGSVINLASVTGTPPSGTPTSPVNSNTVTVPAVQSPALTIVKSTTRVNYNAVGQTIPYSFLVSNTGNVTLTAVTVTDPKTAGVSCPVTTLAPGANTTCTGTHTITETDLDAGSVVNLASVAGTPPSGTPTSPENSNTVTVPAVQSPTLTVVKSTTRTSYDTVGQAIAYSFVVTNTGNVTVTSVSVTDAKTAGVTCAVTTLAPGANTTCTGTHTVTQADLDAGSVVNIASVTATPPSGSPIAPVPSNQVTVNATQTPTLTIAKSTPSASFNTVGTTITYSFLVTNTGNVTVTALSVTDGNASGITCPVTTLAPGAATTCTGTHVTTQADLDAGSVINAASVRATPPSGTPTAPVNSNTVTVPAVQQPALTIVKATSTSTFSASGQSINYTFRVTNTGNVTMSAVTVTDPQAAPITCPATALAPAAETTCTGTHSVTQADLNGGTVVNIASVVGTPPTGTPISPVSSNTVTVNATQTPRLTINKSTTKPSVSAVGESVNYTFTVTNTGNVTVTAITVTDPLITTVTCTPTALDPGEVAACTGTHPVTQGELDTGSVVNRASVSGTAPGGSLLTPANSNTVTVPAVQLPRITVVKSTTKTAVASVGELLPYQFVVTNTGNVSITAVSVTDAVAGTVTCSPTSLAPGQSVTCTAIHTVTQADLDAGSVINTATATATPPNGTPLALVRSNTVTVPVDQNPALSITKSTTDTAYSSVGQSIGYSFAITNTGNVTITGVTVADPQISAVSCAATTLAPGAATACAGTHSVTQADLDNGSVVNTATVSGTPPSGIPLSPVRSNTVTVPATRSTSLSIVKATTTASYSAVGNTINYTFTVTNTGNVTINSITVTDSKVAATLCPLRTLAPGRSTDCTGTHTVTQADLDNATVVNIANVTGTPVGESPLVPVSSNTVTVPAVQSPALSLTKSSLDSSYDTVNQTLRYLFTVTNTGNVTITAVTVNDPKVLGVACASATLAPSASTTCTGTHLVSTADLDNGSLVNTASAVGTDPQGASITPAPSNQVTIPAVQTPSLTVSKTTSTGSYSAVGNTIGYTFRVINTGNVTMTSITVNDPQLSLIICTPTTIATGQASDCSGNHIVVQADLDAGSVVNIASVTGTPPSGTPISPVPSNTVTVPASQNPAITIVKATSTSTFTAVGDTVNYTFTVTNTGNVTLTAVGVTDPKVAGVSCPSTTLGPFASMTCAGQHRITQADLDTASVANTAKVTATPPSGTPITPIDSNTVIVFATVTPGLSIVKSDSGATITKAGDVISYTAVVTNTGNVTISLIKVDDPKAPNLACPVSTLSPGASTSCTGTHTVSQAEADAGQVMNTAYVTGRPPLGSPLAPVPSNNVTVAIAPSPQLIIVKATTTATVSRVDDSIPYTFDVTNTGNVTLSQIGVTDPRVSGVSCLAVSLAPAATTRCIGTHTVTQVDLDSASVVNTASVQGTPPSGPAISSDSNTVTVPAVQNATILIVKGTTTASVATLGESIPYTFIITNGGNVTLTAVSVTDPNATGISCPVGRLQPAGFTTCVGTHTVTQLDLDAGSVVNVAQAMGTPPSGTPLTPVDSNPVTVPVAQNARLSITKSSAMASYSAVGETIGYGFTVRNTGNVTMTAIAVSDAQTGPVACAAVALQPGFSTTCTGSHTVTQADLDAGSVLNTATVVGTPPSGSPIAPVSSNRVTVPAIQLPALTVTKRTSTTSVSAVGTVIPYMFTVLNTGDVTLSNVVVNDAKTTGVTCVPITIAPGATSTCSGSHTTTQADLDAGSVVNTATAAATAPNGTTLAPVPSNTVTVPVDQSPLFTVSKSTPRSSFTTVGDLISYDFTVRNTGNVTLAAVSVTDSKTSGVSCPPTNLAPGDQLTCTGTHVVTQADLDNGSIVNTASVTATAPATPANPLGSPVGPINSNTVTLPAVQNPSLRLMKTADRTTVTGVGAVINYRFTATNLGNVTLTSVTVTDANASGLTCAANTLAPGATTTCTASHVVTQTDLSRGNVVNVANITGTPVGGSPLVPVDSNTVVVTAKLAPDPSTLVPTTAAPVVVATAVAVEPTTTVIVGTPIIGAPTSTVTPLVPPSITLDKRATSEYSAVGDKVDYTFIITNTGSTALVGVTLTDTMAGLSSINCGSFTGGLAPGDSVTCTATYKVTAADVTRGSIVNTATAGATTPDCANCPKAVSVLGQSAARSERVGSLSIPFTGAPAIAMLTTALAMLGGGSLLVAGSRRRRNR